SLFGKTTTGEKLAVWLSHGDQVTRLPQGFAAIASAASAPIAAMADCKRRIYALQFHPEVTHTAGGEAMLRRFAADICQANCDWSMPAFIEQSGAQIRSRSDGEPMLLALSGGVDSAVAAQLVERAAPGKLTCVFVDNGLLREGEASAVEKAFRPQFGDRLIVVDAAQRFLSALAGTVDPETKRKIIGHTFIDVFREQANRLGKIRWLVQGTIYPDVIESAGGDTKTAASIKSHHNVGGLPAELGLELLEPLRRLFKDEVRALGRELGLAEHTLMRHPFPGPGLAVRVLGEVTEQRLAIARCADAIYMHELQESGWYDRVAQAFAVLLPVSTVGVMGDSRTYAEAIALRAVTTDDFMTADWARLPEELLAKVAARIANEVEGVNRVVYDITSKPPATVEWE
ncbi:MAG: glutamine-hydrolyzing GMP synthase, partial [Betaproteobacteria bacterium]|nr:glutamine-hydrolyzing GMP synthase [Betaproteobacteria bacterium]